MQKLLAEGSEDKQAIIYLQKCIWRSIFCVAVMTGKSHCTIDTSPSMSLEEKRYSSLK